MAEAVAVATAAAKPQKLDELMMAMDVVDTIRHRELIVERELSEGDRDAALRKRLHEIYTSQGIAVSDSAIDEGIKALKESRFAYTPPPPSVARSLALLWIRRRLIRNWAAALVLSIGGIWGFYHYGVVEPSRRAAQSAQVELTETLPAELQKTYGAARGEARSADAIAAAESLERDGKYALTNKDTTAARAAITALQTLRNDLIQTYKLVIISDPNASSGVWRIPDANNAARNYYLIVEAVAPEGGTLSLPIKNEETGKTETVSRWGVRVPEATFNSVRQDKQDNGIIEKNLMGEKQRGELKPRFAMPAEGGAITSWDE